MERYIEYLHVYVNYMYVSIAQKLAGKHFNGFISETTVVNKTLATTFKHEI